MAQSKKKLYIYIPQKIGNNKYRTALCKYHQANIKCPFESCCLYAHGPSQLLRQQPLSKFISMLPKYTKNYHKFGKDNQCNEITRHLNRKSHRIKSIEF